MVLDISAICSKEGAEEEKEVHIDMESVKSKMGVFPIISKEPFRLHLANLENRWLLLTGSLQIVVSIPCDRCLADVPTSLHLAIEKKLLLEDAGSPSQPAAAGGKEGPGNGGGLAPDAEERLEQGQYLHGCQLDIDRLVYGELLTVWPMKTLCRVDCKGICSKCGANRNEGDCGCNQAVPNIRMAAFQDVFDSIKE